uniref:DUF4062 domain-containing protein n=1 Tax=Macrostomum lignano TaxID=282301 RepID=A0A1I8JNL4_9PLAT
MVLDGWRGLETVRRRSSGGRQIRTLKQDEEDDDLPELAAADRTAEPGPPPKPLTAVFRGSLDDLPAMPSKIVRIFTSSTFTEIHTRRSSTHALGVRDEATDDHMTTELCLREIKTCPESQRWPNFVVLLGQKYGYRPVPTLIDAQEFDMIVAAVRQGGAEKDAACLERWYKRDANIVPPVQVLQPISSILIHFNNKGMQKMMEAHQNEWWSTMSSMQVIFRQAADALFAQGKLDADQRHNYFMSVVEDLPEQCPRILSKKVSEDHSKTVSEDHSKQCPRNSVKTVFEDHSKKKCPRTIQNTCPRIIPNSVEDSFKKVSRTIPKTVFEDHFQKVSEDHSKTVVEDLSQNSCPRIIPNSVEDHSKKSRESVRTSSRILTAESNHRHTLAFLRQLEGISLENWRTARNFIDMSGPEVDREAQRLMGRSARSKNSGPIFCVFPQSVLDNSVFTAREYIDQFWRHFLHPAVKLIDRGARRNRLVSKDATLAEILPNTCLLFQGREADLQKIRNYCRDPDNRQIFIIYGDPGCGKTSLMAKSCGQHHEQQWQVVDKAISKCASPLFVKIVFDEITRWRSYDSPEKTVLSFNIFDGIMQLLSSASRTSTASYCVKERHLRVELEGQPLLGREGSQRLCIEYTCLPAGAHSSAALGREFAMNCARLPWLRRKVQTGRAWSTGTTAVLSSIPFRTWRFIRTLAASYLAWASVALGVPKPFAYSELQSQPLRSGKDVNFRERTGCTAATAASRTTAPRGQRLAYNLASSASCPSQLLKSWPNGALVMLANACQLNSLPSCQAQRFSSAGALLSDWTAWIAQNQRQGRVDSHANAFPLYKSPAIHHRAPNMLRAQRRDRLLALLRKLRKSSQPHPRVATAEAPDPLRSASCGHHNLYTRAVDLWSTRSEGHPVCLHGMQAAPVTAHLPQRCVSGEYKFYDMPREAEIRGVLINIGDLPCVYASRSGWSEFSHAPRLSELKNSAA